MLPQNFCFDFVDRFIIRMCARGHASGRADDWGHATASSPDRSADRDCYSNVLRDHVDG